MKRIILITTVCACGLLPLQAQSVDEVLQGHGMRRGMMAHRRNRPYCMGSLPWPLGLMNCAIIRSTP